MKVKKWLSVLSTFLMAASIFVFSSVTSAASFTATDAATFQEAVTTASSGDLIYVSGSITLAGDIEVNEGATIIMQNGSALEGTATLTFSGTYARAPFLMYTATLSGLTITDATTSEGYRATIYGNSQGITLTVKDCTIIGGALYHQENSALVPWSIVTGTGMSAVITNNTFKNTYYPFYLEGGNGTTLTLTDNTFISTGTLIIDGTYLDPNAGTISGNIFDPSDEPEAFAFHPLAGAATTYVPSPDDFDRIIADNPAYPVVVQSGMNGGDWVDYPGAFPPGEFTIVTFTDPVGGEFTWGSFTASGTFSIGVGIGSIITQLPSPTLRDGYLYTWSRTDGKAPSDPITEDTDFTLMWTSVNRIGGTTSVPTIGNTALVALGLLLAGLGVAMQRRKHRR